MARPCDQVSGRQVPVGRFVDVHTQARKVVSPRDLPDKATARRVVGRVTEASRITGNPTTVGIEVGFAHRHAYSFGSQRPGDGADIHIPIFDALGADDSPLMTATLIQSCVRADPARRLPSQDAAAAKDEAQRYVRTVLATMRPLLVSSAPPSFDGECDGGDLVEARTLLQPTGATTTEHLVALLHRALPASDGWEANSSHLKDKDPETIVQRAAADVRLILPPSSGAKGVRTFVLTVEVGGCYRRA